MVVAYFFGHPVHLIWVYLIRPPHTTQCTRVAWRYCALPTSDKTAHRKREHMQYSNKSCRSSSLLFSKQSTMLR